MAKQGQHNEDADDKDVARGRNNPAQSVDATAGTPKKQATYQRQAATHADSGDANSRGGGGEGANWNSDTRESPDATWDSSDQNSYLA